MAPAATGLVSFISRFGVRVAGGETNVFAGTHFKDPPNVLEGIPTTGVAARMGHDLYYNHLGGDLYDKKDSHPLNPSLFYTKSNILHLH